MKNNQLNNNVEYMSGIIDAICDPINTGVVIMASANVGSLLIALATTPTKKECQVESNFQGSDHRYFWVPCVHCGHEQKLEWSSVEWTESTKTAGIVCRKCCDMWSEGNRQESVHNGDWIASAGFNGIAGFHISQLYNPLASIVEMAEKFTRARCDAKLMQAFINNSLGQVWEDKSDEINPSAKRVIFYRRAA